jgi:hypothetical protein
MGLKKKLKRAKKNFAAVATALHDEDLDAIEEAINGLDHTDAIYVLCFTIGALQEVCSHQTWTEFVQQIADS